VDVATVCVAKTPASASASTRRPHVEQNRLLPAISLAQDGQIAMIALHDRTSLPP
jgi:hypothetical protein